LNRSVILVSVIVAAASAAYPEEARKIVEEAQNRARSKSQKYEGTLEVVDARNRIATKRWEFLRLGSFGESKSILRFTEPPEVKGVGLLIHNHPDRASDQWMWRPEIGRDQRIALQDRSTRFFATDFSFEDLEERDADQFDYKLLGEETVDGAACWKIETRPKQTKSSQYSYSLLWMRKDHYVPAQIEGYTKNGLVRRISYRDIRSVLNIWTASTIEVFDAGKKSRTVLKLEKLQYNVPLKDVDFTLQALRRGS
jgi:Outer membrane lipoprotein-sorting protein